MNSFISKPAPAGQALPIASIGHKILLIRGHRVILDIDLADLYGVVTKRLNEQVKRNPDRFPADFAFRLSAEEKGEVVAKCDHLARMKFSPTLPLAFTEHGAIMAANVLSSRRAIEVSLYVVRAFVRLREMLASHKDLVRKLETLERKFDSHDAQIKAIFSAIRELMKPPEKPRRRIGF